MKRAIFIGISLLLAGCVSAPIGVDSAQWHKDHNACQKEAVAASNEQGTYPAKLIGAGILTGQLLSKDDPASWMWTRDRAKGCMSSKGYS